MSSVDDLAQRVLDELEGVKKIRTGWKAFCPAHDDRRGRSLSIGYGDDGRILLHCFVGCEPERIVAELGLTMADLFPPEPSRSPRKRVNRGQGGEGVHIPAETHATRQHSSLTLAEYAAAKK